MLEELIIAMRLRARFWHNEHKRVFPLSDYFSTGNECIAEALSKYDPARGASLMTYTMFLCNCRMRDHHRSFSKNEAGTVRLHRVRPRDEYNPDLLASILAQRIMDMLSPKTRAILHQRCIEGWTLSELASEHRVSRNAINMRVHRWIGKIQEVYS